MARVASKEWIKEEFDTKFAIAEKAVETGNYDEVEKWNVGLDDSLLDDD